MSSIQTVITVIIIIAVLALVAIGWYLMRRRSLRTRFGPEYDRVVSEKDSQRAAEAELRERERRHAQLELRPLSDETRRQYAQSWEEIQARFVDSPNDAVGAADDLVTRLVAERGYPTENYEDQLSHLSVEHARTLGHYRDAHDIHLRNQRGEATTEELRQAVVHYRALFADLLGEDPVRHHDPELARENGIGDEAARRGVVRDEVTREDVAREDLAREEAAREEAARQDVAREARRR